MPLSRSAKLNLRSSGLNNSQSPNGRVRSIKPIAAGILGSCILGKRLREVPAVQWLKRWASPSCPVCHFVVMFL